MADAFKCDRCGSLKAGRGNKRARWVKKDGDDREKPEREEYCDTCNRLIRMVETGKVQVQDMDFDDGERP